MAKGLGDGLLRFCNSAWRDDDGDPVDIVEVVRCKDCIGKAHWYKNDYGCTICGLSGLFVVEDRDFCSYGERKDNG